MELANKKTTSTRIASKRIYVEVYCQMEQEEIYCCHEKVHMEKNVTSDKPKASLPKEQVN